MCVSNVRKVLVNKSIVCTIQDKFHTGRKPMYGSSVGKLLVLSCKINERIHKREKPCTYAV